MTAPRKKRNAAEAHNDLRNVRRRVNRARNFPTNTCPASRHVHMIADALAGGRKYHMIDEEPEHVAGTLYAVIESLWKARTALKKAGLSR